MVTIADTTFQYKNRRLRSLHDHMVRVRNEMLELERILGMKHDLTVAKSQELDQVINEYMFFELN